MPSPIAISFFLLLLTTTTSAPIPGLDTFLIRQSHLDPHCTNDSFTSLPSSLKSSLSAAIPAPIPALITSLLSLSLPISIHIRLVGPTSSFPPSTSSSLLLSYLSAAHSSSRFHVISPPNPATTSSSSHSLAISHSPHFDISVSPSLAAQLSQTLDSVLASTVSSLRSPLLSIPYSSIDEIIKQDFEKEKPTNGIFVYLLNLGSKGKNYAYGYSPGESSPGFTKCLGSIWTGKDRYVWIDLGAGPVDYGPALSGDGVLPKGEFHPLAAFHGRPKSQKALLADLASLVWSAYQVNVVTF